MRSSSTAEDVFGNVYSYSPVIRLLDGPKKRHLPRLAKQVLSALVLDQQQQPGRSTSGDGSNNSTGKRKRADAPSDPAAHLVAAAHATVAAELSCIAAGPADGLLGGEPGATLVCVGTHQPALELLLLVGARGPVQGGSPLDGQPAHFRPLARLPLLPPQTSLPDLWPPLSESDSRSQGARDGGAMSLSGSGWGSRAARHSTPRPTAGLGEWHRRQQPRRHERLQRLLASAVGLTGDIGGGSLGAHLQLQHDIPESLLLLPCPGTATSKCQAGFHSASPPSDDSKDWSKPLPRRYQYLLHAVCLHALMAAATSLQGGEVSLGV